MSLASKLLSASGSVDKLYVDDVFFVNTRTGTGVGDSINLPFTFGEQTSVARTIVGTTNIIRDIATNGTTLVAVGDAGTVATSTNSGITWTSRTSGTAVGLRGVCWATSINLFVFVGVNGVIKTSPDGIAWTTRTSGTTSDLYKITWSGSRLFTGSATGAVLYSDNGTSWTSVATGTTSPLYGIVASGQNVCVGTMFDAIISTNGGTTWGIVPVATTNPVYMYLANGLVFTLSYTGYHISSNFGATWTQYTTGFACNGIYYREGLYFLVRHTAPRISVYSSLTPTNPSSWVEVSWWNAASAPGRSALVGNDILVFDAANNEVTSLSTSPAGPGGLTITKSRKAATDWSWHDTSAAMGSFYDLSSNSTAAQASVVAYMRPRTLELGAVAKLTASGAAFVDYVFKKAPKFFDVLTYTGNGVAGRQIPHALGIAPGMVIVKRTDTTGDWVVYHRGVDATYPQFYTLKLNTTAVRNGLGPSEFNDVAPSSTVFTLSDNVNANANGGTYVAYLFAHDPSADGIVQCGSFTTDGAYQGSVTLGWEPQYVLVKNTSIPDDWWIIDTSRGWANGTGNDEILRPNTSSAASSLNVGEPNATGFRVYNVQLSNNYIYMAIRRPNKPPTLGTEVFQPVVYTGTNADNRLVNTGILTDMVWIRERNDTTLTGMMVGDRLRGNGYLKTGATSAELVDADSFMTPTSGYGNAFSAMNGIGVGNDTTSKLNYDTTVNNHIALAFKRAPGVFDMVCYTGTDAAQYPQHNLGVIPQLLLTKSRSNTEEWRVDAFDVATRGSLNSNSALNSGSVVGRTATYLEVYANNLGHNTLNISYVVYLFATKVGISKVGRYTGNGSTQTINCGFTTGSRFILIKRTDSTGDWYVWDTARGIIAGNDPHLSLNTGATEVTTDDSIDPHASGFIVNQVAATNLNVASATYIYLSYS